jgi:hypothetical protein
VCQVREYVHVLSEGVYGCVHVCVCECVSACTCVRVSMSEYVHICASGFLA